jgi:arylsulfatase A-like enzyme
MNLLLVSIDSLRWDYVSRTHPSVVTPAFDRLTDYFLFIDRFFAVSSATRPVHSSLLTGLYPFEHGVLGMHYPAMRPGIPHLFDLCEKAGYQVRAYSQAPSIFTGLAFFRWLVPYQTEQVYQAVDSSDASPTCLFLHYWDTHTPYGAADGKALGETLDLLKTGHTHLVQQRYIQAIETLFEDELAPLLSRLDMSKWCVIILSDHGESWTQDEPYHGQTLNNSVLRVPLYLHLPGSGNPPLLRPINSQIDILPTLINRLHLPLAYHGFGVDLFNKTHDNAHPYYLAQIDPIATNDDFATALSNTSQQTDQKWALFNAKTKFSYDQTTQQGKLEDTISEHPIHGALPTDHFIKAYEALIRTSQYNAFSFASDDNTHLLLEQRLKELGYLA